MHWRWRCPCQHWEGEGEREGEGGRDLRDSTEQMDCFWATAASKDVIVTDWEPVASVGMENAAAAPIDGAKNGPTVASGK